MKKNITFAAVQKSMSRIMDATGSKPWNLGNEVEWFEAIKHPTHSIIKASVSRNKREGKYLINRKGV